MTVRFNPPPNWPPPPAGWAPPANWQPDPGWPPAPAGWTLWVDDNPIAPVAPAAPPGPVTIAATSQGDYTQQPVPGPAPVPFYAPPPAAKPPIPMVQPAKASSEAGEAMGPFGKSEGPDIAVGDIVAQRRHYVFGESGGTLTDGPDQGFEGTRWRVKEIAEQQYRDIGSGLTEQAREPYVELELVEGVYQYRGSFDESELPEGLAQRLIMMAKGKTVSESPGFIMQLVSSNAYRRNHPDQRSNQQFFEEWQKASGDLAGKDPIRQEEAADGAPMLEVNTALLTAQADIALVIAGTGKGTEAEGFACLNLVITPNHDWTDFIVKGLKSHVSPAAAGVGEDDIAYVSDNYQGTQLEGLGVAVERIRSMGFWEQFEELDRLFGQESVRGASFVVSDINRKWTPGSMEEMEVNLKQRYVAKHGSAPTHERVRRNLWLVGFERMDAERLQQRLNELSRFGEGAERLAEVIEITSIESARDNQRLRDAAAKNAGWSVDVVLANVSAHTMRFGTVAAPVHAAWV